ncbi:MAG: hypothetical protein WB566_14280, partial [Terriglobales bacterium]
GVLAEKYGLSLTMWLAAAGSAVVFLVALSLRKTTNIGHGFAVSESSHEAGIALQTASEE